VDGTEDVSARAQRLGRLVRNQRDELGLSQAQFAKRADVHVNTISRLEAGATRHRQSGTWTKVETALDWPQGFIADYLAGEADETALAGRFRRDPVPEGDLTGMIHDMVFAVLGAAAPDTTLAELRESELIALEVAKRYGYVPALRQDQASNDQTGEDGVKPRT
jgi:transcriptional regulator with XRE-family HTH domain